MTAPVVFFVALVLTVLVSEAVRFVKGRNRELRHWQQLAAKRHAENCALRELVFAKTGVTAEMWWYADICKALVVDNPRSNIKIEGM